MLSVGSRDQWSYFPSGYGTKREMRGKPKNLLGPPPRHGTSLACCHHLPIPKMALPPPPSHSCHCCHCWGSMGGGVAQSPPPGHRGTVTAAHRVKTAGEGNRAPHRRKCIAAARSQSQNGRVRLQAQACCPGLWDQSPPPQQIQRTWQGYSRLRQELKQCQEFPSWRSRNESD